MYLGYQRMRRSAMGLSLDEVENAAYLQDQLMRYTIKQPGPHACWLWGGHVNRYQCHGRIMERAQLFVVLEKGYMSVGVAKLVYLFDAGEIAARRRIRHTCGNSLCVRPSHIVLAEQNKTYWARIKPQKRQQERDALARMMAERAIEGISGETVEQVRFYNWLGESTKGIAKNFGLNQRTVERILEKAEQTNRHRNAGPSQEKLHVV